ESAVSKEKEAEFSILYWTLVVTTIGVIAGLLAFGAAALAVIDAQKQARNNSKTARALFWMILRGLFSPYDELNSKFRPGGEWHGSLVLPAAVPDMWKTEVYMGLFEACDRLLEDELINKSDFVSWFVY